MPELKPCPFCGKTPDIRQIASGHGNGYYTALHKISCPECRIEFTGETTFGLVNGVPKLFKDGYSELLGLWNRRANDEV